MSILFRSLFSKMKGGKLSLFIGYGLTEIVLIFVSVSLVLWFDNEVENRRNQMSERGILEAIRVDLLSDIDMMRNWPVMIQR